MTKDEIKDTLLGVVSGMIKDESDETTKSLHDVLAAKLRDRISPPEPEVDPDPDNTDPDNDPDPDNNDPDNSTE